MRARVLAAVAAVAAGLAARCPGHGVIELRSSARAVAGVPVTLSQVASLEGPDAVALGQVVVLPARGAGPTGGHAPAPVVIDVERVRTVLESSGGVNWGRVSLRGSRCTVLPPAAEARVVPVRREEGPAPASAEGATVRSAVTRRLAAVAGVPLDRLRLRFDERDAELLETPTVGRSVEVTPTAASDRVPLSVSVYAGDRTVASGTIRVGVEVRRDVLRSVRALRRGEVIDESSVERAEAWMPLTARPAAAGESLGAEARAAVRSGAVLMEGDVRAPMAAARGEIVSVRVVSGSVVVTTKGRALASAREGEMVRLQALDSKREFTARMDGRQRAVVGVGVGVGSGAGSAQEERTP